MDNRWSDQLTSNPTSFSLFRTFRLKVESCCQYPSRVRRLQKPSRVWLDGSVIALSQTTPFQIHFGDYMEIAGMIARGGGSLQYFNCAILLVTIFNKQSKGMKRPPHSLVLSSLINNPTLQAINFIILASCPVKLFPSLSATIVGATGGGHVGPVPYFGWDQL